MPRQTDTAPAPLLVPQILLGAALYLFYARLQVQASIWTLLAGHPGDLHALRDPQRHRRARRDGPALQWQGDPTIAAASTLQILIIGMLILVVQRIFRLRLMV